MKRITLARLAAVGFLLACTAHASAQTACPVGTPAGSATCGPSGGGAMAPSPPRPTGEWLKTWGAIATSPSGNGGVSSQQLSKEDAEKVALRNCASVGGTNCIVEFTYRNQCVAAVRPLTGDGGQFTTAATVEEAKARALRLCQERFGKECTVVVSECSDPVFRRF